MPIYEFQCEVCSHEFEELVRSMTAKTPIRCPSCGDERVRRRLSVFAAPAGGSGSSEPNRSQAGGCGRCGDPAGPCSMP